jgi:hypothetical protein
MARPFAHKPAARYALACIALAAMIAAPFVTFGITGATSATPAGPVAAVPNPAPTAVFQSYLPAPDFWERVFPWLVASWFAGVIAFSIRLTPHACGSRERLRLRPNGSRLSSGSRGASVSHAPCVCWFPRLWKFP